MKKIIYIFGILMLMIISTGCTAKWDNFSKKMQEDQGFDCHEDVCSKYIIKDNYQNEKTFYGEEMRHLFAFRNNEFEFNHRLLLIENDNLVEENSYDIVYNYKMKKFTVARYNITNFRYDYDYDNHTIREVRILSSIMPQTYSCYTLNYSKICDYIRDKCDVAKGIFNTYLGNYSIDELINEDN